MTTTKVRTLAELHAGATMLLGDQPRPARAAAATDDAPEPPATGTVGELWLYGVVGGWWRGFDAESVARALRELGDIDTLYVRIHSPGGSAAEGIAIANLLRNLAAHVVTVVDGYACSSASVIAVAGDEVVMCPGAQLMLHDASTGMYVWGDEEELRAQIVDLEKVAAWIGGQSQNYAGIYAYKAGGTPEAWRQVMTANGQLGKWYSGAEAVAAKLADRVGTITAVGSPPVAPEDDFDETDDDVIARLAHDLALLEQDVHPAARAAWQGERLKPPTASAGGSPQPEGAAVVDLSDKQIATLREQVRFPADADADTIVAAVAEALSERAENTPTSGGPTVGEGQMVVSKTVFEDVTAKAESGARAAEELLTMKCDAVLERFKDRFPATDEARAKWAADYRRDPAGTEQYLAQSAVLVPTTPVGHGGDGENQAVATKDDPNYQKWSF